MLKLNRTLFVIALTMCSCNEARAQVTYTFTTIDQPGFTGFQLAGKINNAGQIVGYSSDASGDHGFLRSAAGTYTTIDAPGASGTRAFGINNLGQIVGEMDTPQLRSFLRAPDGTFTTIGPTFAAAQSINDAGQVVGYFNAGSTHGFVL